MIRDLHRDDVLPARDTARHLERGFDRLRARIDEEERLERWVRHDREQTFYEAQIGPVIGDVTLTMGPEQAKRERGELTCPWTGLRHWPAAALLTLGWQ